MPLDPVCLDELSNKLSARISSAWQAIICHKWVVVGLVGAAAIVCIFAVSYHWRLFESERLAPSVPASVDQVLLITSTAPIWRCDGEAIGGHIALSSCAPECIWIGKGGSRACPPPPPPGLYALFGVRMPPKTIKARDEADAALRAMVPQPVPSGADDGEGPASQSLLMACRLPETKDGSNPAMVDCAVGPGSDNAAAALRAGQTLSAQLLALGLAAWPGTEDYTELPGNWQPLARAAQRAHAAGLGMYWDTHAAQSALLRHRDAADTEVSGQMLAWQNFALVLASLIGSAALAYVGYRALRRDIDNDTQKKRSESGTFKANVQLLLDAIFSIEAVLNADTHDREEIEKENDLIKSTIAIIEKSNIESDKFNTEFVPAAFQELFRIHDSLRYCEQKSKFFDDANYEVYRNNLIRIREKIKQI